MNFLFWLMWIINALLLLLSFLGKTFRSSFGAGVDLNVLIIITLLALLAGSLVLRFAVQQKWVSLIAVSLPLCMMVIWYVIEKISGKSV